MKSGVENLQKNLYSEVLMNKNDYGFYFRKLRVVGENQTPAQLSFIKGFNVISGLSDTGKSYAFSCIDFVLGAAEPPKELPESKGYSKVQLEIGTYNAKIISLERSLQGGNIITWEAPIENDSMVKSKKELKPEHTSTNEDNISSFMLDITGLTSKKIRKNKSNEIRNLSFRDIARLIFVDEVRIQTEKSPAYASEQYTNQTQEQSIFNILLGKNDDSKLKPIEKPKVKKKIQAARLELLENLINETNEKVDIIKKEIAGFEIKDSQSIEEQFKSEIEDITNHIDVLTASKKELVQSIEQKESQLIYKEELIKRFQLLQEHYLTDLSRLEFINEAEFYTSQLGNQACPLCGSQIDETHYDCMNKFIKDNNDFSRGVKNEINKISLKLNDLKETLNNSKAESELLKETISVEKEKLYQIKSKIEEELLPHKSEISLKVSEIIRVKQKQNELNFLLQQIDEYNRLISEPKTEQSETFSNISKDERIDDMYKRFCDIVKDLLAQWSYPNIENVEFDASYENFDLIISNKRRKSNGKGYRAISFSAFIIGLMDYCLVNDLPHPYSVVLDSPLTTYHGKEADKGEEVEQNMQDSFFRSLSRISDDKQLIVFDNKVPPNDIIKDINYIYFSGEDGQGRKGFFPTPT